MCVWLCACVCVLCGAGASCRSHRALEPTCRSRRTPASELSAHQMGRHFHHSVESASHSSHSLPAVYAVRSWYWYVKAAAPQLERWTLPGQHGHHLVQIRPGQLCFRLNFPRTCTASRSLAVGMGSLAPLARRSSAQASLTEVAYWLGFRRAVEQKPRIVTGAFWPRADRRVCCVWQLYSTIRVILFLEARVSSSECSPGLHQEHIQYSVMGLQSCTS